MKKVRNYQIEWKDETRSISDLVLDPQNIRLEGQDMSQSEIIADLFVNEHAMDILESILDNGFFPDETPVVVRERGRHMVLEGNRRVASLQAMIKPALAPDRFASKIQELMKNTTPLKRITVRVAESRAKAQKYLAAKHTVDTRRPWSTLRRAYFYYAQKEQGTSIAALIKKYKGIDIPRYVRMYEMHRIALALTSISETVREGLANRRKFDISTLERLYGDDYVQKKLGISFAETGEVTAPKTTEFTEAYARIINDIVDKIVTSRKKISDEKGRKEYIDELVPRGIKKEELKKADSFTPVEPPRTRKSTQLDTKGIDFQLPYPAVERMFIEIQKINIDVLPNAAHDLLRSFLECSLKAFFEIQQITIQKKSAFTYLDDALRTFEESPDVAKIAGARSVGLKKLVSAIRQNGKLTGYTADFMNQINHSHYFFSDRDAVRTAWDTLKPLFMFILSSTAAKQ